MTRLIHRTGDIFASDARAIGHGVNVDGVMGAGIAVGFRRRWGAMYEAYAELCRTGDLEPGGVHVWRNAGDPEFDLVLNIASQDRPGRHARLEWVRSGVRSALRATSLFGLSTLSLPRIASGIGGLIERDVERVLEQLAAESAVDIELWTFEG